MESKGKIPYEMLLNKKGRARLPDKLMDHLNDETLADAIWWLPDGESFAMDSKTAQEKLLDVYFRGTKLTSFIRSLNRWGFRRVFFHAMPRNAICFQSPQFKKGQPELLKEMKLAPTGGAASKSDRSLAGTGVGPSATAAASSGGQVDALFRQEPELQSRSQLGGPSMTSQVASLPSPLAMGSAGLSSLQNTNNALGLSRAGIPSNHIQFPGLPSMNANPGRDQALLNAMIQRDDLLYQLQREKQLQQRQQALELQQQLQQQQQQQTLDMQYVQSLFQPQAASLALPPGRQSLPQPQGVATLANRASIYAAAASARQRQGESKQGDPTSNQEAANAALADFLRRRQNNNDR